jgi:arylsulfatase A-like enzyme
MRFVNTRHVLSVAVTVTVLATSGCSDRSPTRSMDVGRPGPPPTGPVAVDLVGALPTTRVFTERDRLDFGDPTESVRLVSGWGRAEEHLESGVTFAWANAPASELLLDVAGSGPRRLVLRGWPYRAPDGSRQTVDVSINGRSVGVEQIGRVRRRIELDVPDGVLVPGRNTVRFEYAYVVSPADTQAGSNDRRQLAVAFDELELEPAVDRPVPEPPHPVVEGDDSIRQSAGTAVVFDVRGPEDGVLAVTAEVTSDADGVAEVWARPQDGDPRLLMRFVPGTASTEDRIADLADLAWERFDLVLALSGSRGEVRWTRPRIIGRAVTQDRPPNVVLIVVDTLRADAVGVWGGAAATPVMDRLAAEGVVFEQARSHIPITGPSHSSMFVSVAPFGHGVVNNASVLAADFATVAEVARDAGRTTAGFVSLGVLHHDYGFDQGFERYADAFHRDWMKDSGAVLDEVFAWLDGSFLDPFLAFVHFSEPHEPYSPPGLEYPRVRVLHDGREVGQVVADGRAHSFELDVPSGSSELELRLDGPSVGRSFRVPVARVLGGGFEVEPVSGWQERRGPSDSLRTYLPAVSRIENARDARRGILMVHCVEELSEPEVRERYALEVESVDRSIGELLERLRQRGHLDHTVVIVTSDHGEGLGDHGLIGHINQLYDSLLHVPLIVWGPGRVPRGVRIADPVALLDLPPTIAELAGLGGSADWTGQTLTATWNGGWQARPIVLETHRPEAKEDLLGLVWEGYKLIRRTEGAPRVELYDLSADPGELHDLADAEPDVVARLEAVLDREVSGARARAASADLSDEEKAQLRALGYLHE